MQRFIEWHTASKESMEIINSAAGWLVRSSNLFPPFTTASHTVQFQQAEKLQEGSSFRGNIRQCVSYTKDKQLAMVAFK